MALQTFQQTLHKCVSLVTLRNVTCMASQTFQQTLHKGVRFGYIEKFDWYDLADISTNPSQRCQFGSVGLLPATHYLEI